MRDFYDGSLSKVINKLTGVERNGTPFISLYLKIPTDESGRDELEMFVRKELDDRARIFAPDSLERDCFERDAERILSYLHNEHARANRIKNMDDWTLDTNPGGIS